MSWGFYVHNWRAQGVNPAPECAPYGCARFTDYIGSVLSDGTNVLNLATNSVDDIAFPVETGLWDLDTNDKSSFASTVDPSFDTGDPCTSGAWDRVLEVDTTGEQTIAGGAPYFPDNGTDWGMSVAILLKNDPDALGDPVTLNSMNQVAVFYIRQASVTVQQAVDGVPAGDLSPSGSGTTGVSAFVYFTRDGTDVSVYVRAQGSETAYSNAASVGTNKNFLVAELTVPEAAWEDWMVISVTLNPVFTGETDGVSNVGIKCDAGDWKFEIAYNENAGTASPRSVP
jgi:hypothetical protein